MIYPLMKAVKKIIDRFVVNMTPLKSVALAGSTTLSVVSTRRYCPGDGIVIYNKPSATIQSTGEVHTIADVVDINTILIDTPLIASYPLANSYIEKLIGYEDGNEQFLEATYLGSPSVIPRFPAITIDARSRASEWLTLESTKETFEIEITVYVTAADYQSQLELMHTYVRAIERSLFRSFYPLVEPYDSTELAVPALATDTIIQVTDPTQLACVGGWIWFESYELLRYNKILENLGNGVFRLAHSVGADFAVGDHVIRPRVHVYNTLPYQTQYGIVNNENGMLQAARISYRADVEQLLHTPFIDPLTF